MFELLSPRLRDTNYVRRWINPAQPIDITEGDSAAVASLQSRVEEASGEIAVVVHPFYKGGWASHFPLTGEYRDSIEGLVETANNKGVPVVIFEEEESKSKLSRKLPLASGSTFIVNTIKDDPTPATAALNRTLARDSKDNRSKQQAMEALIQAVFVESGVVSAHVGGRYLFIDRLLPGSISQFPPDVASAQEWVTNNKYPNGCVGGVVKSFFRNGVEATITDATAPNVSLEYVKATRAIATSGLML